MRLIRSSLAIGERVQVMGILNVTPDSFSDGGQFFDPALAVERALAMAAAGADLIDIGGESTRPGAAPVTVEEELNRVVPVLEGLRGRLEIPVSIDTVRSEVARRAVELGAEIINDVSGLRHDERIADVAASTGAGLVLMHSRGTPATMQKLPPLDDALAEVGDGLAAAIAQALARGVERGKLIIDPGIGFGKTPVQNLQLINQLDQLITRLGCTVLLGTSRKSFIRLTLDRLWPERNLDVATERLAGTAASLVVGVLRGARIVRVHDVAEAVAVVRLAEAILAETVLPGADKGMPGGRIN